MHAVPYAELMTTVAHELRSLVDGTRRRVGLATRALGAATPESIPDARRQLQDVLAALDRMSGLLRDAMIASPGVIGSPSLGCYEAVSLGEATRHAVAVVEPIAALDEITIRVQIDPSASATPVGPLYPILLNGLRNAIEAIASLREEPGDPAPRGLIVISAGIQPGGVLLVRIEDDGPGPVDDRDPFTHGYTTKQEGTGLGLSITRSIVDRLAGGMVRLTAGSNAPPRRGAVLELHARPTWAARASLPPPSSDAA